MSILSDDVYKTRLFQDLTPEVIKCVEDANAILHGLVLPFAGVEFRPYQITFANVIFTAVFKRMLDEIGVLWARQSGKTEVVADACLALCIYFITKLKKDFSIGFFSPAKETTTQVTRKRLVERFSQCEERLKALGIKLDVGMGHFTALFQMATKDNYARVRIMTGSRMASIKGETFDLIIIEQSEDMDASKMLSDIFPMLSATGGVRILVGTPALEITNDYYYKLMTQNLYGSIIMTLDCYEAMKYSKYYAMAVQKEKLRMGYGDEFKSQYELNWVTLRTKFITRQELFPLQWAVPRLLNNIPAEYVNTPIMPYTPNPTLDRFAGWDVAKEVDMSVVTVIEKSGFNHYILGWLEMQGTNWEYQADFVKDYLRALKPKALAIDSTGSGDPCVDMASNRMKHDMEIIDVIFNVKNNDIIGKILSTEFGNKRIFFPHDLQVTQVITEENQQPLFRNHFIEQMLDLERTYTGDKLHLKSPDRRGVHDDYADSCGLALYASLVGSFDVGVATTDLF